MHENCYQFRYLLLSESLLKRTFLLKRSFVNSIVLLTICYCFSPLPSEPHETRQVRGSPRFPRTKMSEVEEDGGARCEDKLTEVSLPDFKLQKNKESLFSLRSKTGD